MWGAIIGLFDKALGYFVDTPEVKAKKVQMKNELALAKLEKEKAQYLSNLNATSDYDNQAMKNKQKSWMDEIIAFIHLAPIWLPAIDALKDWNFTLAGESIMLNLLEAPAEWWMIYFGIVSSTFGLRWLFGKQEVNKMIKEIELRRLRIQEKEINNKNKDE